MTQSITVKLSSELKRALDEVTRQEGISRDEIVGRAIQEYIFLLQFRFLRDRFTAAAMRQGIAADQDVFDCIS
jgi:predicted transcriptional regulator